MKTLIRTINTLIIFLTANAYSIFIMHDRKYLAIIFAVCFVLINIVPSFYNRQLPTLRLRVCSDGCELLIIFLISTLSSVIYLIYLAVSVHPDSAFSWILCISNAIIIEAIIFWNGIIRVYLTSMQLVIKWRLIGVIFGWIPIAHLFVLFKIIRIVSRETIFESEKILIDQKRENDKICCTKYPILLVHGVFFRDFKYFNYWGRIPDELKKNGATIYYGNQQSAASIADCGKELAERIRQIAEESGCGKVNIIAHSKGGLDSRYAVSRLGAEKYVASVTTINTPHRGCLFADYLLSKLSKGSQDMIAQKYNTALKKFGDKNPDFLAAVNDLTASSCKELNDMTPDIPGIFYQSIGSKLNKASDGRFPLNFSYHLVKYFDGPNDGLVSADSFIWGEKNSFLTVSGNRGISHGDVIDLNRENIEEFDVREFYVGLVHNLKVRGF
ncbi:MAG: triacylglycerol lipase [Candidatus Metalachnospira sp.]|nr:triacylglycerol lipase [Candidatus Metalachnospira sp.]